jgi:pyruvate formate lyase activating enzyme
VRARDIALKQGLYYVYTENVHNVEGDTTFYASCSSPLIVRDWHQINQYRLNGNGTCPDCGSALAGKFDKQAGNFGQRRIPIAINEISN